MVARRRDLEPHDTHTSRDQPVVTALQLAWVRLLQSVGVDAAAAGGLSGGEVAAAWCCEAIDLGDTIHLALQLGRLADQDASMGGMGTLRADFGTIGELIEHHAPEVARAVEMSGDLTVIAGPSASVDRVMQAAASRGIGGYRLPFERAYHNAADRRARGLVLRWVAADALARHPNSPVQRGDATRPRWTSPDRPTLVAGRESTQPLLFDGSGDDRRRLSAIHRDRSDANAGGVGPTGRARDGAHVEVRTAADCVRGWS